MRKKIFKFAQDILGGLTQLRTFFDKIMAPLLPGESIRPGTAKTCRPYSVAKFAVIMAPLLSPASTTRGSQGHARNDAVSDRKGLFVGRTVEWELE